MKNPDLIPVFTPKQMRAAEKTAFDKGVHPLLLMEDAARSIIDRLRRIMGSLTDKSFLILAGPGNNGGDGTAIARLLLRYTRRVHVLFPEYPKTESHLAQLRYYQALDGACSFLKAGTEAAEIERLILSSEPDCVIDALYGTGFHGKAEGITLQVIQAVNRFSFPHVISVDIPSGMNGETGETVYADNGPCCIRATHTMMLGVWKKGLLNTRHTDLCGKITLCPIDLPLFEAPTASCLITKKAFGWIAPRESSVHKGSAGRVLFYAGSMGMCGAAAMAARAALTAGAGLVTILCTKDIMPILQTLVPNAMCLDIDDALSSGRLPPHDVLAAGCGIGRSENAIERLRLLISGETSPVILDADGLNILAQTQFDLPENTLLTPHPAEAARLMGVPTEDILSDLQGSALALTGRYGVPVLLKSHVSVAAWSAQTIWQRHGSPLLAKGGSGDALCGIIAALAADRRVCSGSSSAERLMRIAALSSMWLGLSAEAAAPCYLDRCALTSDILSHMPKVLIGERQCSSATNVNTMSNMR